jgi:hypothetical protein
MVKGNRFRWSYVFPRQLIVQYVQPTFEGLIFVNSAKRLAKKEYKNKNPDNSFTRRENINNIEGPSVRSTNQRSVHFPSQRTAHSRTSNAINTNNNVLGKMTTT